MARPKTAAANYKAVTFRMPRALHARVLGFMAESGAPLNTELIKLVTLGVSVKDERVLSAATSIPAGRGERR